MKGCLLCKWQAPWSRQAPHLSPLIILFPVPCGVAGIWKTGSKYWPREWTRKACILREERVRRQSLLVEQRISDGQETFWVYVHHWQFPFPLPLCAHTWLWRWEDTQKRKRLNKLPPVSLLGHWELLAVLAPVALKVALEWIICATWVPSTAMAIVLAGWWVLLRWGAIISPQRLVTPQVTKGTV